MCGRADGWSWADEAAKRSRCSLAAVFFSAAALSSEDTVIIAVNVTRQRKHIDSKIDRILKRQMGELKKGRQVRNPKLSQARYSLSKAVQAQTLKKTFTVYDIRRAAAVEGRKISNW